MKPFAWARPKDLQEALSLLSEKARPKGGGYDLLDLAKNGHPIPEILVDVRGVRVDPEVFHKVWRVHGRSDASPVVAPGAALTLSQIAEDGAVRELIPALSDAASMAATPQVRNAATLAGNLLQRPRCAYFRDPFFDCLKRGGKTCPALEGEHTEGAIFGNGKCCAVHPSNLAVALLALGAKLRFHRKGSEETVDRPLDGFFVAPEEDPLREARIGAEELLLQVLVDEAPASAYVEVDQKQSFDWASAAAAVALKIEGGKVAQARVALGAVAPVPLLSEAAAAALVGKVPDEKAAEAAADAAVKGATPLRDNAHKVRHLRACVKRAVLKAAARGR